MSPGLGSGSSDSIYLVPHSRSTSMCNMCYIRIFTDYIIICHVFQAFSGQVVERAADSKQPQAVSAMFIQLAHS